MEKMIVLLAVVALVAPAFGGTLFYVGPLVDGDWSYESGTPGQSGYVTNWNTAQDSSGTYALPGLDTYANIVNCDEGPPVDPYGATVRITADVVTFKPRLGGCIFSLAPGRSECSGHVIVDSDVSFTANAYIAIGEYMDHTLPMATFTQSDGTVFCDTLLNGHACDTGPGRGNGKYTISGGRFGAWYDGIYNGDYDLGTVAEGKAIFRIEGDAAVIGDLSTYHHYVRSFKQSSISRLELVLTSSGTVSPINCNPRSDFTFDRSKTSLEGTLQVDPTTNGFTPTVGYKVKLIEIQNGITGYIRDDLLNYKAGDSFDTPFTPSPLVLEAPEGWGLIDNGLGILSAKFRLGDVGENGSVGQDDLDAVLSKWGQTQVLDDIEARWIGDPSCDEFVGQEDLDLVLADWGEGTGTIPEPVTMVLLCSAAVPILLKRRRKA